MNQCKLCKTSFIPTGRNQKYCTTCKKENFEQYQQKYNIINKEKIKQRRVKYYQNHKKEINKRTEQYRKLYYKKNKERMKLVHKEWYLKNKEKILKKARKWRKEHRTILSKKQKERLHKDIAFRIIHYLRVRLNKVLKNNPKLETTMKLVGCNINKLKLHLESQFKPGMNWNNYGKWEVDHILPCASFDFSKSEEQRKCFNYKNLQPLWKEDNRKKHKKIDYLN